MIHRNETTDEPEHDVKWFECRSCGDPCEEEGSLCEICGELLGREIGKD